MLKRENTESNDEENHDIFVGSLITYEKTRTEHPSISGLYHNPFLGVPIKTIACGDDYAAILSVSGELFTWGTRAFGKLGLGLCEQIVSKPRRVTASALADKNITLIGCGHAFMFAHVCGPIDTLTGTRSYTTYSWGAKDNGEIFVFDKYNSYSSLLLSLF